jgi:restriction system protein
MSVPDFQTLMLPLLREVSRRPITPLQDVRAALASEFELTVEDITELLPSGRQARFANRVGWAATYLKQAGLLDYPSRAILRITERGRQVLAEAPAQINIAFLGRFEEFVAFRSTTSGADGGAAMRPDAQGDQASVDLTPDELLRAGYQRLRQSLAAQVLERVRTVSDRAFEELVVDLLVRMGYGGSREDAGAVVGGSGDGGIDGIIKEDRLGLEAIYVQAKKWTDSSVGRPDVQKFAGALQGKRARKGVFITTSRFSADARDFAGALQSPIVLIDGTQLAELMLDYGVGVSEASIFKVWRLDEDYFESLG